MSICDNSLLISFNSRIQIRVHFIRFEHCQVSICDNSFANSFIFGFLELFYFSFLYRFIVIICPEAKCRFVKPLQHFLLNLRPPEVSFQACSSMFFYIQTSSASSRNWKSGSLSISICNNSPLNFFISDIRRGDLRRCGLHFH